MILRILYLFLTFYNVKFCTYKITTQVLITSLIVAVVEIVNLNVTEQLKTIKLLFHIKRNTKWACTFFSIKENTNLGKGVIFINGEGKSSSVERINKALVL